MVNSRFVSFFSIMGEGGAALLGLLFVAVSIRRAGRAPQEPAEAVVVADATLFAALHPDLNVGYVALAMSVVGLAWGPARSFTFGSFGKRTMHGTFAAFGSTWSFRT
jgi:hypothetical protein